MPDVPTTEKPDEPPAPVCQHTESVISGAKASTCEKEGYTGDTLCKSCGILLKKGEAIAVIDHAWDNGTVTKMPTCIETGVKTFTCGGCHGTRTESLPTVPHSDLYHDALDGTHNHTCSTCTMNENQAHVPTDSGKRFEKTCTEAAYVEYTCRDCKSAYKVYSTAEEDQATGHSFGDWSVHTPATCVSTGSKIHSCECGHSETLETPMLTTHEFVLVSKGTPSCVDSAISHYDCLYCDATKDETVEATGIHSYKTLADQGDGWTRNECTVCQHLVSTFDASKVVKAEISANTIPSDTAFEVNMEKANIQFPQEVVSQLKGDDNANVEINADVVTEESKKDLITTAPNLTEEQKERLENVDIYDFGVTVNSNKLSSFEAAVTVTMPYVLKDGEDPEGILIWYVKDDGTVEEVKAVYNEATQEVVFSVEHFSFYAVAYQETQAMRCRRGVHDYQKTDITVEATCTHFGYTVYLCSCGATTLDDIVEKNQHDYGDLIAANLTCDHGDYITRVCKNCFDVLNVQFVRALGHTPDHVATCDTPSTCTTCHQIIKGATGHNWTEWKVIKEPTDVSSGLRRRYCLTCGKEDEVKMPPTGNIETLEFDSFQELLETYTVKFLGFGSGKVEFSAFIKDAVYDCEISILEKDGKYTLYLTANRTGNDGEKETIHLLYKDGQIVAVEAYEEGEEPDCFVTDINLTEAPDVDVMLDYITQAFDLINPMVEESLAMARETLAQMLEVYGPTYAPILNKILEKAGVEYTVDDLSKILDLLETFYVYSAYKLGMNTNLEMVEGIEIPSRQDLILFITTFLTETEENGIYTYSFTLEPVFEALNELFAWFAENADKPFSDLIFDAIDEELAAKYPEITSWDALIAKLRADLPGTMVVKTALDYLITLLESTEICTIEELYALINTTVMLATGAESFDIEAMLMQYHNVTLDELLMSVVEVINSMMQQPPQEQPPQGGSDGYEDNYGKPDYDFGYGEDYDQPIYGEITVPVKPMAEEAPLPEEGEETPAVEITLDMLYQFLDEQLPTFTFNSLSVEVSPDQVVSLAQLVASYQQILEVYSIRLNFSLKLNAMNEVVGILFDAGVDMIMTNENGETITQKGPAYYLNIDYTENVTMEIPEKFESLLGDRVTTSYDENGNLIINGLDPEKDYSFTIGGSQDFDLSDALELDPTMTAEFGYNVYVLKKEFWNSTTSVGSYILKDGKYYEFQYASTPSRYIVTKIYTLNELMQNPDVILPTEETVPGGYISNRGDFYGNDRVPCYVTPLGLLFSENGEWMLSTAYFRSGYTSGMIDGVYQEYQLYYVEDFIPFSELSVDLQLSTMESDYNEAQMPDGTVTKLYRLYFDGMSSSLYGFINEKSELCLVERQYIGGKQFAVLGKELTSLPEHDQEWLETDRDISFMNADGELYSETVTVIRLEKYVPSFFVKLEDGVFANLSDYHSGLEENAPVKGLPTMTLPSGKTFYLLTNQYTEEYINKYGVDVLFGYTHVVGNLYAHTACYMENGEIARVVYRNSTSSIYSQYSKLYKIDDYLVKKSDGSYVISAQLLATLKARADQANRYFDITVNYSTDTVEESYVVIYHSIPEELELEDLFPMGGSHGPVDTEAYLDWYEIFEQGGKNPYGYTTELNEDGSLTIQFNSQNQIHDVEYRFYDRFPASVIVEYDEEMSEQTGLNIYSYTITQRNSNQYVLSNGKYYNYSIYWNHDATFTTDVNDLKSNIKLDRLYYNYDFTDEQGNAYRVYRGEMSFSNGYYYNGFTLFFVLKDGVLYGAQGAQEMGESVLQFESLIPYHEYLASLSLEIHSSYKDGYYSSRELYLNHQFYQVYDIPLSIMDHTSDGTAYEVATTVAQCIENGSEKLYIKETVATDERYLKLHSDMTDFISDKTQVESYTEEFYNGTFTFVAFEWTNVQKHSTVKLAGEYYDYNESWDSYSNQKISEEQFQSSFLSKDWYYFVDTDQGRLLYNAISFDRDGNVILDEILTDDQLPNGDFYDQTHIGYTVEGYSVYEVLLYVEDTEGIEYETLPQDDGTVYYERKGQGYLKAQDGYYVDAIKVSTDDGSYKIVCGLYQPTLGDYQLQQIDQMSKLFLIDEENQSITIQAGTMEFLKEFADFFELYIGTNYDSYWFTYYELENLYLLAQEPSEDNSKDEEKDWTVQYEYAENGKVVFVPAN
ncbi:MAG: hypothetical protein E7620_02195 [Ruminococcaceae bacterium]|nr:hypothetical protein [Oscillospiraceae bacterium]